MHDLPFRVLDDAAWEQAEPISDFVQVRPSDGGPPSETTEVYLLYDDDFLYDASNAGPILGLSWTL